MKACIDVFGDFTPANNCGMVHQPGPTNLSITPSFEGNKIRDNDGQNSTTAIVKNLGTTTVAGLRPQNGVQRITVNGGPLITVAGTMANGPSTVVSLKPGASTKYTFKWNHPHYHVGDVVLIDTCVVVPIQSQENCSTQTFVVTK